RGDESGGVASAVVVVVGVAVAVMLMVGVVFGGGSGVERGAAAAGVVSVVGRCDCGGE
nr:hypothetical protein [Tanacetum cinerariifolium]